MRNSKSTTPVEITLPVRIVSITNERDHWRSRSRRAKAHRHAALAVPAFRPLPCKVTLTRIAPQKLDDDNLRSAFKSLRDGIADRLGVDDRDPRVVWKYRQERGAPKTYAARVEIVAITQAEADADES